MRTATSFTGFLGESFRFQILNDGGEVVGSVLSGQVKRIFRQGRQISVELYILGKHCTHAHEAKRIYYKGRATNKLERQSQSTLIRDDPERHRRRHCRGAEGDRGRLPGVRGPGRGL